MNTPAYVVLSLILLAQGNAGADRAAIQAAEAQHHGSGARVTSILISGDYAIARGIGNIHDGLQRSPSGWRVVCALGSGPPSSRVLQHSCGFAAAAALQLTADELANTAASAGAFTSAVQSERAAYRNAPKGLRESEAARLQLLNQLNQQITRGQITRADAIRKWNELRLSVYLP